VVIEARFTTELKASARGLSSCFSSEKNIGEIGRQQRNPLFDGSSLDVLVNIQQDWARNTWYSALQNPKTSSSNRYRDIICMAKDGS
jgi:hypothetical protein